MQAVLRNWSIWAVCLAASAPALTASADEWADEQRLGVFVFRSDFSLRDIAPTVEDLGELQKDIEATLNLQCRDRGIIVHLFRSQWSYSRYIRQNVPEGAGRPALFVAGPDAGRIYAIRRRDLDVDLRHETTHALLHNALPYVPLWLDEGLAEYFERPANRRFDGSPHRRSLQWAIRFGWKPRLDKLEAITEARLMEGSDYRDAWGIVHFLLHGPPEARAALDEYLATIPTGREPTPLSISLKRRLPDFERQVIDHLR
jgi:hypothetical protein